MSDGEFWKARDGIYYDSRVTGIEAVPLKPGEPVSTVVTQRERTMPEFADVVVASGTRWATRRGPASSTRAPDGAATSMIGPVKAKDPARSSTRSS